MVDDQTTINEKLIAQQNALIDANATLKAKLEAVGVAGKAAFTDIVGQAKAAYAEILASGISLDGLGDKLLGVSALFSKSDMFNVFAEGAKTNLLTVSNAMDALGKQSGLLGSILSKVKGADMMMGVVEKLGAAASQGQLAEAGFYAMTTASGQLNKAWGEGASQIGSLGTRTADYMDKLANLATQNRTTLDATIGLSKAMSDIPELSKGMVNITGTGADHQVEQLERETAILRVAAGAGKDQSDVLAARAVAYANLGNAQDKEADITQRGINLFSTSMALISALNITFEDSRNALNSVAEAFRDVGDETDGAAKIFDAFGAALNKTGISSKASLDITKQMIVGLKDMTVAQKAFLSQQSGGVGGVQGSLQIDEMMRKGDIAGVMGMAQNTLKQRLGGRILTQQEGAEGGQQTANQYLQQRQMVQSGIFGIGKGADDQTAGRILEALKQGDVSGMQDTLKTGQDKAGDLAEKGNAIQVRNETKLNEIVIVLQRIAIAEQLGAASKLREIAGNGKPMSEVANQLNADYEKATSELQQHENPVDQMGKRSEYPDGQQHSLDKLRGHATDKIASDLEAMFRSEKNAGLISEQEPKQTVSPILPINSVSETHKRNIAHQAQQTSPTAAIAKQAQATKETISKTPEKEQTVKVMIELNDPGKNVKSVKTTPAYQAQHKKDLTPTSSTPSSDPGY